MTVCAGFVPVGAPCNVCEPDERHGLIARIRPDGSGYEVFARGVRNSVGFDFDPHWKDHVTFNENFHGDTGRGLGASHQTGWTALVAKLIRQYGG